MISRRFFWVFMLAAAFLLSLPAYAQYGPQGRDQRWENSPHAAAYNAGFEQGREDRRHNRSAHPDVRHYHGDAARAYREGYRDGYERGPNWNRGPMPGPGGPGNVAGFAYRRGYDTGLRNGTNDRRTGHRYTPTDSAAYNDADEGYNRSMGDKRAYGQEYRRGYMDGYNRGYGRR